MDFSADKEEEEDEDMGFSFDDGCLDSAASKSGTFKSRDRSSIQRNEVYTYNLYCFKLNFKSSKKKKKQYLKFYLF